MTITEYAKSFIGTPYRWGGDDPILGFDCSGFVQECLASVGMDPSGDQSAQALYNFFAQAGVSDMNGPGALAFYGKSKFEITHVVLMVNEWQGIGANGGGSKTVDLGSAAASNAFIKIRPVDYRKDLVAILMPKYPKGAV
jgi:cell wall-associated NlpC family hydrolase